MVSTIAMNQTFIVCLAIILLLTQHSSAGILAADDTVQSDDTRDSMRPIRAVHSTRTNDANPIDPTEYYITPPEPGTAQPVDIVNFSKLMYSSLSTGDENTLAELFRPTFDRLDHDRNLGDTLDILYDMRLMDLQASIRHARKMKDIIELLKHKN